MRLHTINRGNNHLVYFSNVDILEKILTDRNDDLDRRLATPQGKEGLAQIQRAKNAIGNISFRFAKSTGKGTVRALCPDAKQSSLYDMLKDKWMVYPALTYTKACQPPHVIDPDTVPNFNPVQVTPEYFSECVEVISGNVIAAFLRYNESPTPANRENAVSYAEKVRDIFIGYELDFMIDGPGLLKQPSEDFQLITQTKRTLIDAGHYVARMASYDHQALVEKALTQKVEDLAEDLLLTGTFAQI